MSDRDPLLAAQDKARDDLHQERSLSRRIGFLVAIASLLLIGQSIYNLSNLEHVDESIDAVQVTAGDLEELARDIARTIAGIQILSMESVLSPNQARIESTIRQLDQEIAALGTRLQDWQLRLDARGEVASDSGEFLAVLSAWENYRKALTKTSYYIQQGIRVAAFISVTQEEKLHFEALQDALDDGVLYARAHRAVPGSDPLPHSLFSLPHVPRLHAHGSAA
jgi:hypothetical protein